MSIHVRPRSNGKSYELRVKHRLLSRPFYATLGLKEEAQRLGERALVELNSGKIPSWMQSTKPEQSVCIAKAVSDYRAIRAVPASTRNLLDTIANEIGSKMLSQVDYAWAENWIRAMKREKRIAPGTIRKKKGALSRVFDWVVKAHPLWLNANPLKDLPHGYSGYDEFTRNELEQAASTFRKTRSAIDGSARMRNTRSLMLCARGRLRRIPWKSRGSLKECV